MATLTTTTNRKIQPASRPSAKPSLLKLKGLLKTSYQKVHKKISDAIPVPKLDINLDDDGWL